MELIAPIIVALFFSMYFAAMETAYTAFDRILLISWSRAGRFGARTARFLSAHPERFLGTTLVGNNLANVAFSSLIVLLADTHGIAEGWVLAFSPIIILLFAEIMPKSLGYALSNRFVRFLSNPLLVCYYLLYPVQLILRPLTRSIGDSDDAPEKLTRGQSLKMRHDLDQILVGAQAEGALSPEEAEILESYLDARDLKVRQIMTPRTEIIAVSADATPDEVREVFRRTRYNLLPVYEHDLDHITGYVSARDFLSERLSVLEVLRPLHAVPESKRIVDLLQEFRRTRRQVALVIDEYGGTDGLVTLRDIFEELVGPVAERFDPNEPVIKRVAPGKFLVSGAAFLEDVEDATGWSPPEGDFNTLSGLLAEHLGHIADTGEEVEIDGVVIRVIRRSPRRVEACLLKLTRSQSDEDSGTA